MAHVIVVGAATPAALQQVGHTLAIVGGAMDALDMPADVVVVDASLGLTRARQSCTILGALPRLLLCAPHHLPLLDATWDVEDVILAEASEQEWAWRLDRLLGKGSVTQAAGITIDEAGYTAHANGRPLDLTYTEFELLKFLVTHPGRVFTRDQLVSEVWGYDYYGGTRTVDVHVRRLRAKLGPELADTIETVRNVGYRFAT